MRVKGKNWRRVLFICMLLILGFVTIGYQSGLFNPIFIRYNQEKIENDLSTTPEDTDVVTGASNEVGESTQPEIKNEIIIPEPIPEGQSQVSIVQSPKTYAKEILPEEIREMVRNAVTLAGGLEGLIKDGQVVVLKPNLVQKHVDSTGALFAKELNGITTDWRVTEAVVELVREQNPHGKVYVMEGSAGDATGETMEYLNYTREFMPGVDEFIAIEEDSGGWKEYDSPGLVKHSLPTGLLHQEYYLNKKYAEADVIISIPCLKTSSGAVITGGIKNTSIGATPANIYGVGPTNPGRTAMVSHKIIDGELDQWIYDYFMCKPVEFVVIDGLEGFQNGPVPIGSKNVESDKMNMRLIMAGKDAVAVDSIEALVAGWDPLSVTYLGYLNQSGMGNLDTARITVVGKQVQQVRKNLANKLPKLGGIRVTDTTAPKLTVISHEINGNVMNLQIEAEEETVKAEIYLDDQLYQSIRAPEFKNIDISVSALSKGVHHITLYVYDRFLNCTEEQVEFNVS